MHCRPRNMIVHTDSTWEWLETKAEAVVKDLITIKFAPANLSLLHYNNGNE